MSILKKRGKIRSNKCLHVRFSDHKLMHDSLLCDSEFGTKNEGLDHCEDYLRKVSLDTCTYGRDNPVLRCSFMKYRLEYISQVSN